jgi:polar amino acid transport system substrate-binding protein
MALPVRYAVPFLATACIAALLLTAGCLSGQSGASAGQGGAPGPANLTYYTEEHPPYNYQENGTLKGFAVDLLGAVTERMGRKVSREEVRLVNWSEGYQAALTQNGSVLFATARLPEREQSFKWAGPIYTDRSVLFAKRESGITIRSPEDLKGYRIGVVAGDVGSQQLLDAGVSESQLVPESNVSALIAKLESGEIDLWSYTEFGGRYLAEKESGNYHTFTVAHAFDNFDVYYAFNNQTPDATVASFQQALDGLKGETDAANVSAYDRILGRHIPSIGLAQLTYLTEEWAPFNYLENGTVSGLSVEVLEAVWHDQGVNRTRADVRVVPLSDAFRQARNNTSTVVFSIVRTPERDPLYKWAGPFTRGNFVLWAPVSKKIVIASDADLQRYRIGAVEETVENDLLAERGVDRSQVVHGKTPEDLLRMVEQGQIDLWATGDLAGRSQMLKTAADPNAYEIVDTLSENDFYYIFSRDVPDVLVSAFEHALERAQNEKDAWGVSAYERIIYRNLGVGCTRPTFSDDAVTALVNGTAAAIESDAADTFTRINAGEAPYRDPTDPALYAFVYDTNLTMVAHAGNIQLVGVNFRGKTDVTGRPFRDEILTGATENGTGWVDYVYMQPGQMNLYYKTTYYRLARGSDGKSYVVCSGNFKRCE